MTMCEAPPLSRDPEVVPPVASGARWERAYRRRLLLVDGAAAVVAGALACLVRPGADRAAWDGITYAAVAGLVPVVWVAGLALLDGSDPRHLGAAGDDYRNVIGFAGALLASVAVLTWATDVQVPRAVVLLFLAATTALSLAGRAGCRQALRSRRRRGECLHRVLAVGQVSAVQALAKHVSRDNNPGAVVVGCCLTPTASNGSYAAGSGSPAVPVIGGFDDVVAAAATVAADTVAVLPCPELEGPALRRLAWALEGRARHFVVIPGLADVARPRLSVRPISGLAVLHVRHPRLTGAGWAVKAVVDRAAALAALVVLAPLLAGIAVVVRASSPGPALFRQTRVGLHGREFTFLKFRTMHVGAERRREELASRNINADGVLFKVRDDPRVTPVGVFLRRWSLDELPQLLNVLAGQMSLVGPRPPLPQEAARYADDVRRRLLVKPGLTGLWQVSGRSDLSWDDAVRLDLRYVDNWSLALDVAILSRTVSAVVHGSGAY
jgi:exopolysaccharide biosynthesis polyprenyl glycosylphosphotransferase